MGLAALFHCGSMRLDPNTHAFVAATAFITSVAFAIAAMNVLAFVLARFWV
ncbi:MAG: hypothetical protein QOH73_1473 [Gaiellaceae bacterium]|jgi:hypothetical protein|nr:hypothetical protein [Gaiellaceae bacterium]